MELMRRNTGFLPSFFNGFEDDFFTTPTQKEAFSRVATNIIERDEDYLVELAIPGMEKKDITIDLDGNRLLIKGTKKVENKEETDTYSRREFSYGTFSKSFTLPKNVDVENIEADYVNGVLTVAIPKPAEQKKVVKQIEVKG